MPFAPLAIDCFMNRPDIAAFSGYSAVPYQRGEARPFDITRQVLEALRYGQTTYPLRKRTEGAFYPQFAGAGGEYLVDGFQAIVVGQGNTPNLAYHDWLKRFHAAFQRLYVMRPFEMAEREREAWGVIENQVDVERYRASQPIIVRQQGKVVRARPYPDLVQWEDGTRERVSPARMPADFVTFMVGQPFEAVVHRDPTSYKILKVEYLKRLSVRAALTREESKRLWDSLPTSGSLPDTDWD
jgi:hypothetical protein